MGEAILRTCRAHVWERHLEVRNKQERVVRVCVYCGANEICWSRPPLRSALKDGSDCARVASLLTSSDGSQL